MGRTRAAAIALADSRCLYRSNGTHNGTHNLPLLLRAAPPAACGAAQKMVNQTRRAMQAVGRRGRLAGIVMMLVSACMLSWGWECLQWHAGGMSTGMKACAARAVLQGEGDAMLIYNQLSDYNPTGRVWSEVFGLLMSTMLNFLRKELADLNPNLPVIIALQVRVAGPCVLAGSPS